MTSITPRLFFVPLAAAALAACSDPSASGTSTPGVSAATVTNATSLPNQQDGTPSLAGGASCHARTPDGDFYFFDPNAGGQASEVRIERQFYGRLVQVVAFSDPALTERVLVHEDFVVDPRAESQWAAPDYALETNPVTGVQTLVIFRDFTDTTPSGGCQEFVQLLEAAAAGVRPINDAGFVGAGVYSMVPRNAAIVIEFDDLIDATTINAQSLRVLVDVPAVIPFEARVFADPNHGDLADLDGQPGPEFYSTRVIVDPAISEIDSFMTIPPLAVNVLGLPASLDVNFANVQVRIATQLVLGQTQPILRNPVGNPVASSGNGSVDLASASRDVVRAFRSGGRAGVIADPFNGFLPDETPPEVVGGTPGFIALAPEDPPQIADPLVFNLPRITFRSTTCAQAPVPGDLIQVVSIFAEVLNARPVSPTGVAEDVLVRLVAFPPNFDPSQFVTVGGSPMQYLVPFDPVEDSGRPECFVTVSPTPQDLNAPSVGISTASRFSVRFSEPMDPEFFEPYESIRLTRTTPPIDPTAIIPGGDLVPGLLRSTVTRQEYRFEPVLRLSHVQGNAESYFLSMPRSTRSPIDVAGNRIQALPSTIEYTIEPTSFTTSTGGRVTRFEDIDEEPPFADTSNPNDVLASLPKPEWSGQVIYDLPRGRIRPRPVVRSQVVVSRTRELPASMVVGPGTRVPLSTYGARTQMLWRTIDFGTDLPLTAGGAFAVGGDLDLPRLNIDVEGVALSPLGGSVAFESFPDFSMRMSHSDWLPDEVINPITGALVLPQSGLRFNYGANEFGPPEIVHERQDGYSLEPGDLFLAADGTPLLPLPMNQGTPASQRRYYTWRDTSLRMRTGVNGAGAPILRELQIRGIGPFNEFVDPFGVPICSLQGEVNPFYLPDEVRSAALPLLIDLRCYPTLGAPAMNAFDHQIAHFSSSLPAFRAFTAGGVNQGGSTVIVDPDSETIANGGFDPATGAPTSGLDNTLYLGSLDLVTRVSRVHSVFFPANDPLGLGQFQAPIHVDPVVFPAEQPLGTDVEVEFRGAVVPLQIATEDASRSDAYGDFYLTKPINYTPGPVVDPLVEYRGNASCFDGSFSYRVLDENWNTGFLNGDDGWKRTVNEIQFARWFQARLTFTSNAATGRTPEVAAIGFAWLE